ncbi:MAG: CHAT domain-containing protein [Flammeovirgaceae bacterium]
MRQVFILFLLYIPFIGFAQNESAISLANRYTQKADSLFDNADYQQSTDFYQKASTIYKEAQRWEGYSHCQNKLAENLARLGNFDEAFDLVNQTLKLIEEKIGKGNIEEAGAYNALGLIQLNKGRDDLALDNFNKSLELFRKLKGDQSLETAQCYTYLGLVHWDSDNTELALDFYRKALSIRKKKLGAQHPVVASSMNDIGLIYAGQEEEMETALKYFLDALLTYEEVYGDNHPKVANSYINLANIYREQRKYNVALTNYQKALDIWENVYGASHPNEGFVFNSMGRVYADQKNWDLALQQHEKALAILQKNYGEKHPKIATTYNLIGAAYGRQFAYKKALESYQKAVIANVPKFSDTDYYSVPDLKEYYNPTLLLLTLQRKAQAFEALHFGKTLRFRDLKAALQELELCDELIAKIRQTRSSKKDKIALGVIAAEIYEEAIRICLTMSEVTLNEKHYLRKAFEFAEKSKAAVLLAAISDTEAKQFANIPNELLEQEKELKSEISSYEQKAAEAANAEEEETYRVKLFEFNQQYAKFIQGLESKFPDYFNLKYNVKTATVADVQAALDDETALISYFIAEKDKRLYTFMITKNKFIVSNNEKDETFEKYQIGLQNSIIHLVDPIFLETARGLYEQLFPKKIPAHVHKLMVIPDGSLGMIPFEVLLTRDVEEETPAQDWPYLIKKYAVNYNFSSTLYVQAQEKQAKKEGGIFLCGPVTFTSSEDQTRSFLSDLPGTEQEINSISAIFQNKKLPTKSYLRDQAQESLIKSGSLKGYKYLHFPTHGLVDQDRPELSKIFLASPTDQEDGSLHAGEIYNLEIDADLVCLSACQTGLGKITKGEGIIGLSRALVYAGANNLIVSYWTVSDASTAQLMTQFYKELTSNTEDNYTESLQKAKLKLIQSDSYAQPYYWAPFVLIGR